MKFFLLNRTYFFINFSYAGRTELPDNLKSMFRPIAMCVPDSLIIAENTLFSDGFTAYKINAKKVNDNFSVNFTSLLFVSNQTLNSNT